MTQKEITDDIDLGLSHYIPAIAAKQAQFLFVNGHYFQGLTSCSVIPSDGAAAVCDQWDKAPNYENGVTWRQAWGGDPPSMQSSIRVDQYIGANGAGYVLVAQVTIAGRLWQRCINFGPETWREMDWQDVTPVALPAG